jgi:cholesterol oxidase
MATVIVIGSGFGGAIAAKRFTAAGHSVIMIEMGEDWRNSAKLQQSQDTKFIFRLFRDYPANYLQAKPNLVVTQGMGFGGGSLVYSGIHLRAPTQAFTGWPSGWTRAHLDPYYTRVETRLGVAPLPNGAAYHRSQAFAAGAAAAGLPAPQLNPLAMTGCTKCGWCVPICKWGKKNTMQHTYLLDALNTGLMSVYTNYKANYIAKYGSKYRVIVWSTSGVTSNYHLVNSGTQYYLEGDWVVVACGAIESPVLLQRSLNIGLPSGYSRITSFPTGNVGNGIDGTGDFVQGGIMPTNVPVDGYKGAIMMNYIDRGNYVLEDLGPIPVGPAVKLEAAFQGQYKAWGLAYKQKFQSFGRRMIGVGIMGKQGSNTSGNISVSDSSGNASVSTTAYYPPDGSTYGDQQSIAEARSIITALGGEYVNTPWERTGTAATVHPTGGCRMGDDASQWAVQPSDLQLRNNPGLWVIDGSVLPSTPMRNPSNTIAAVAERAMDVILGVYSSSTWPSS